MTMSRSVSSRIVWIVALAAAAAFLVLFSRRDRSVAASAQSRSVASSVREGSGKRTSVEPGAVADGAVPSESSDGAVRAVCDFDAVVVRWKGNGSVEEADVRDFVRAFDALPPSRKEECLHRALNLVPDANVALLKGILFDGRQPERIVRAVFADILNRPDTVKKPILDEILATEGHPCREDVEWIFKAIGARPAVAERRERDS